VDAITDSPMPYEAFNDAVKKVGEETALRVGSKCNDWFQFNADELNPAIKERDQLLHALRSPTDLPPSIINSMCAQLNSFTPMVADMRPLFFQAT
jgi:hypothetical protein